MFLSDSWLICIISQKMLPSDDVAVLGPMLDRNRATDRKIENRCSPTSKRADSNHTCFPVGYSRISSPIGWSVCYLLSCLLECVCVCVCVRESVSSSDLHVLSSPEPGWVGGGAVLHQERQGPGRGLQLQQGLPGGPAPLPSGPERKSVV